MLQLHFSDQQFCCILRCDLYQYSIHICSTHGLHFAACLTQWWSILLITLKITSLVMGSDTTKVMLVKQSWTICVNTNPIETFIINARRQRTTKPCGYISRHVYRIMYVLEWRTVYKLTRELFWCLCPVLRSNEGNKHQNNTWVSLWRHCNEEI